MKRVNNAGMFECSSVRVKNIRTFKHSIIRTLLSILPFAALAETNEVETLAVTNTWIVSNTTNSPAWTRQAVMARDNNAIIDPSGVFVSTAETAAQSNAVNRLQDVCDAAIEGMARAVGSLEAVTNQVPETAYHVAVAIPPPTAPASLMGFVVKEETDGTTDTQWVWYSHRLGRKPIRRVVYRTPSGDFSQNVEWVDWNADGETITAHGRTWNGCHKCTVTRPTAARGISAVTRLNEVFGGESGWSFGGVTVTVGGRTAVTTNLVGKTTGRVMIIDNGFLKTETKEAANEE